MRCISHSSPDEDCISHSATHPAKKERKEERKKESKKERRKKLLHEREILLYRLIWLGTGIDKYVGQRLGGTLLLLYYLPMDHQTSMKWLCQLTLLFDVCHAKTKQGGISEIFEKQDCRMDIFPGLTVP